MTSAVFVLNGPNLNMLGMREPGIYGKTTLSDIESDLRGLSEHFGCEVVFRQSNHEGQIVDWLHEANEHAFGVILNAAALTHTSVAVHDAVRAISIPVIEVHLSNTHAREEFRHKSFVAPVAVGTIAGFGALSYSLALQALCAMRDAQSSDKKEGP